MADPTPPEALPTGVDSTEPIPEALRQTLDEARMVLPGVQALFGFQLIAVFSDGFERRLGQAEQSLHLVAILLVTVAIALVMTPAAYHRQVDPRGVTLSFLTLASWLVSAAMLPLAAGLAIDVHLIARLITGSPPLATATGAAVFALFIALWFAFPQWRAAQARRQAKR